MWRLLIGASLLWSCLGCAERQAARSYNVVVVTLDTTRADRMSCYGYEKETTPHFDTLAGDGVRFDFAVATAAVTPVSHASILTGLNPYRHGLRVLAAASGYELSPDVPSLTTILKEQGWSTAAFLSAFPVSEHFGFDNGFDVFDNGIEAKVDEVLRRSDSGQDVWPVAQNQRRSDQTTDRAIEWLARAKRPFFLWVHYWDPHDDYLQPPEEIVEEFTTAASTGARRKADLYDAEVHFVDAQFGRLVSSLERLGVYDETVLVVTADHGEGLGDHDWWTHRILYQEQIRVPLIIRSPTGPHGRAVSSLVRSIDIAPTVLDWLGLDGQRQMEGRSLVPLMSDRADAPRIAYADQLNAFDTNASFTKKRPKDDLLYCAIDGRWKLIHRPRHPRMDELYDLSQDPGETLNLYGVEPVTARRLLRYLEDSGGFVDRPFGESVDEDTLKRLEALGYIGD